MNSMTLETIDVSDCMVLVVRGECVDPDDVAEVVVRLRKLGWKGIALVGKKDLNISVLEHDEAYRLFQLLKVRFAEFDLPDPKPKGARR